MPKKLRTPNLPKFKFDSSLYIPVMALALIVFAFLTGYLLSEVKNLKGGNLGTAVTQTGTDNEAPPPPPVTVDIESIKELYTKENISFGDGGKKNLFVMVSDPSCPFCHLATGLNPNLNETSGEQFKLVSQGGSYVAPVEEMRKLVDQGDASFVWIYSPGHGNGEMGAKALYCADEQNKFWEAHDKLMTEEGYTLLNDEVKNENSKSQEVADFLGNAVNGSQLKECLDSGKYDDKLTSDSSLATSLGVSGTPGFFVNENRIDGAASWTDMESYLK